MLYGLNQLPQVYHLKQRLTILSAWYLLAAINITIISYFLILDTVFLLLTLASVSGLSLGPSETPGLGGLTSM